MRVGPPGIPIFFKSDLTGHLQCLQYHFQAPFTGETGIKRLPDPFVVFQSYIEGAGQGPADLANVFPFEMEPAFAPSDDLMYVEILSEPYILPAALGLGLISGPEHGQR